MAYHQIFLLCSLLVAAEESRFPAFKCADVTAELRGTVHMTCTNNKAIQHATVKFCGDNSSCPAESDINTFKNIHTVDNGRISLKIINESVILSVYKVQISDQRRYKFHLDSSNGHEEKWVYLKIVTPYTEPQVTVQRDTAVCTASGGYPERQLYWFAKNGANLTHYSKLESVKNEDGSFSLNSTIQLKSLDSNIICLCSLNDTINSDKLQGSACVEFGKETFTKEVSQAAEETSLAVILMTILVLAVLCAAAAVFGYRKKREIIQGRP